jgi:glyoxylase-like metal-dependent hydrolase (beta-lactamase superfamily II)
MLRKGNMKLLEQVNNIYAIDTKMFGLDKYMSAFLVKGQELAMVDTGQPRRLDAVRAGINANGFAVSDISRFFVTHCEHPDHAGNIAALLRESPKAKVYINPIGKSIMINPKSVDWTKLVSAELLPKYMELVNEWEPTPESRIETLKDGQEIDLGDNEKLKVMFTHGHQPSGMILFESKNNGLFINDLVGNCFLDADSHYPLSPTKSDNIETVKVLKKLLEIKLNYLYLGHYGITDEPRKILLRSIEKIQVLLDIGKKHILAGTPDLIPEEYLETIVPELDKLRAQRGEPVYQYASKHHIISQGKGFIPYCQQKFGVKS